MTIVYVHKELKPRSLTVLVAPNRMHGRGCYMDREKSRWDGDFFNGLYDNGRARVALR